MKINVFRIDDRLIHGQIVTSWLNYADANQIVVCDDKAAKDSFQQSLLRMATPKGIGLKIISLEKIKNEINDLGEKNTLFLVRGPQEAVKVVNVIPDIKTINVGNLNMSKGKEKVLDNLWVYPEDIKAFEELDSKNIEVEYRTLPNDNKKNVIELLKHKKMI
ncbi:PTS sugar transporter subunit IIB [Aerococcus urinae]|uniref:PTS system mannose/fructose/N-acetylgalactosamine-transporter subunit IIB n=1 Tax=Aerococcus urinae TaxID=1376 RepID=UPI00254D9EE0|nr:PTS sugar transporter subunit IIB [Aerococcus urinae]MDK6371107.1 PTS sugar transporter subunit IIB [Aerococcus urinae]